MSNFVPRKLVDFVPDEDIDDYGYVWKKEQRSHTIELVGYDGGKEMSSIVLDCDESPESLKRADELSWVQDRANFMFPDGITLNIMKEIIRNEHEIYGI